MDTKFGKDLGPLFINRKTGRPDGRFEYVPIWGEDKMNTETYSEHKCREINSEFGVYWSDFLRPDLAECRIHHDPMFEGSWTYGESRTDPEERYKNCKPNTKMGVLQRLKKNDLLVFTAGLKKWKNRESPIKTYHLFIIGYFRVQEAIPFYKLNARDTRKYFKQYEGQISKNAHYLERSIDRSSFDGSVIVVGKQPPQSQLLPKAFQISQKKKGVSGVWNVGKRVLGHDGITRNWVKILGFDRSVTMSYPRKIDPSHVRILEKVLGIV